ncbi:22970_t:CDS:2 [Cetraspora pellucida]|uniref:22970_t:CDS:1 n=1 Tax=Cetraspora pellucida TaxID=1433469 RepID=A0A9N9NEU1_9GLOM|nr:22970_t:CDS:2 [Cetraspora pellucida]
MKRHFPSLPILLKCETVSLQQGTQRCRFQTEVLGLDDIFGLIAITLSVFWIDEFRKHFHNQKQGDDYGIVAAIEMDKCFL